MKFAFFGTGEFSLMVLQELNNQGFTPSFIVCGEDKLVGRKRVMTAPATKSWGQEKGIPILQPNKVSEIKQIVADCDLFVLASYGKILPQSVLDIPKHGTLNVHPSFLPKYRGASPLQSAILNENETGVSIMLLVREMDAGPILMQRKTEINWPPYCDELEVVTAKQSGQMLVEVIPQWVLGKITLVEQDHGSATYCVKIKKEDGLLNLEDSPEKNLRKICAYRGWPNAYFMIERGSKVIRVVVREAHIEDGKLVFDRVIPEGSREMDYASFARGLK